MNNLPHLGFFVRLWYRTLRTIGRLGRQRDCEAFAIDQAPDKIQRIYVINLDRHGVRWQRIRQELQDLQDQSGRNLISMTRRFRATDARNLSESSVSRGLVQKRYTLADQLFVEPDSRLSSLPEAKEQVICMTREEIAVALSHISVWRTIAEGKQDYALVLEDDVFFRRSFAPFLATVWDKLLDRARQSAAFDVLYLSYQQARGGVSKSPIVTGVFSPTRGLWQLSGYVLSRRGAQRLLDRLPVYGPVDLWLNHQFNSLEVVASDTSIIEQRRDCPSANSYSVLPVLAKVGLLTEEKPLLFNGPPLPSPVFAFGERNSGLSSLAMALSMLGYRCCSDVASLPVGEHRRLFSGKGGRVFDAYVNAGPVDARTCLQLAICYPHARFIIPSLDTGERGRTREHVRRLRKITPHVLDLPAAHCDKWDLLCRFLDTEHPADDYPEFDDIGQRRVVERHETRSPATKRTFDQSPWIVSMASWRGLSVESLPRQEDARVAATVRWRGCDRDKQHWALRDDTFPSNLALFRPENFSKYGDGIARLTLREDRSGVRAYTSGSICSRRQYLYGKFAAEIKPASGAGLITGLFLHRNSPRQEIDLEFLGRDTTKLLTNIYYNPGADGARFEFGYRGTPVLVDLEFDAAAEFHHYEIDWGPNYVRWRVDGEVVCERVIWDPTPVPHLPMQFNVNLWPSRSSDLAGNIASAKLPAHTELRGIEIHPESLV